MDSSSISTETMENQNRRAFVSQKQKTAMIEFMLSHKDLALNKLNTSQARKCHSELWNELSQRLHKLGPEKPIEKWQKVWSDIKQYVKKKAMKVRKHQMGMGGESPTPLLNHLEEAVVSLLGLEAVDGLELEQAGQSSPTTNNTTQLLRDDKIDWSVLSKTGHFMALSPVDTPTCLRTTSPQDSHTGLHENFQPTSDEDDSTEVQPPTKKRRKASEVMQSLECFENIMAAQTAAMKEQSAILRSIVDSLDNINKSILSLSQSVNEVGSKLTKP